MPNKPSPLKFDMSDWNLDFLLAAREAESRLRCQPEYDEVILELANAIVHMLEEHGGHAVNVIVWMYRGEIPTPELPHSDDWDWWAAALIKLEPLAGLSPRVAEMN